MNVQQLQDQNTLLKAQRNNNVVIGDSGKQFFQISNKHFPYLASFFLLEPAYEPTDKLAKELETLKLDNENLRFQLDQKSKQIDIPIVSVFTSFLRYFCTFSKLFLVNL